MESLEPTGPSEDWKERRDDSKAAGDAAFREGRYQDAIQHYSQAISLDPDFAVALSNRSAAYLKAGEKSNALHDAQACVKLGTMGLKGKSRLAAALQALGRYEPALQEWQSILKEQDTHVAALQGSKDCQQALEHVQTQNSKEQEEQDLGEHNDVPNEDEEKDELDAFFDEVEEVTDQVKQEKIREAQPKATNAIKNQKKDLGTARDQIARLLQPNYKWRNLNPFYVLDVPHTASKEDISRRYKALSLLLHPDKNLNEPQAQEAYDQVLHAKELLDDEGRYQHSKQLVEEGLVMGEHEWKKRPKDNEETLEDLQRKAVFKIFAQVEQARREMESRERTHQQREKMQEKESEDKLRHEWTRDKDWKQTDRVEKRIGNWRDFQTKAKKPKTSEGI